MHDWPWKQILFLGADVIHLNFLKRNFWNGKGEMLKDEETENADETEIQEKVSIRDEKKKRMSVSTGIVAREDPADKKWQERQEYKLREKMIKKKHRNLYRSMMKGKAERSKEAWLLAKKRRLHDEQEDAKLKGKKKEKKTKCISSMNMPVLSN